MAKNVKSYFEHHAHSYSDRHIQFYSKIANYITDIMRARKKGQDSRNIYIDYNKNRIIKVLDVGCGNGSFIKAFIEAEQKKSTNTHNNDYYFLATDVSFEMIKLAKGNLKSSTDYDKSI